MVARVAMGAAIHLIAGLNGSGKTTLAKHLAATLPGVRFSLDEWMLRLHGLSFDDVRYSRLAGRCRELIWEVAAQVLAAGVPVVLDWNMYSRERRADAVRRAEQIGVRCHLHYLKVPIDVAVARAAGRRDITSHTLDAEHIAHLQYIFEAPGRDEGFTLHEVEGAVPPQGPRQ